MIRNFYRSILLIFITGGFLLPTQGFGQEDTTEVESDTLAREEEPVFSLSGDMLESSGGQQEVPGLLRASGDVFVNKASYNFSSFGYRMRGYEGRNTKVMLNGIPFNHPELGFAIWSYWGGLNDVTRYAESRNGITKNSYDFGGIGGYSNIDMRASSQRAGTRISYALTNRSYRHRAMATHSTGTMDNGLALTVSGSGRYSDEGYVPGTFYRSGSYFLAAEQKINEDHSIGFVGFGAPTVSGGSGISRQEAYDLAGSNYYNSYWGYQTQDGEKQKRNSRVRNSHQPVLLLNHYWDINEKTNMTSGIYYQFGKYAPTRLNWYDAQDPRPDYYRYLPSYHEERNPSRYEEVKQQWETNEEYRQLDWDHMYFANSKNLYTVEDVNGEEGNDVTGNRSKYIVESRRSDMSRKGIDFQINHELTDNINIDGGGDFLFYESRNYKTVNDLLGGDYWVDVNQFAERDFEDPEKAQNDVNDPNDVIKEGEKFGYDYSMLMNRGNAFIQGQYKGKKLEGYLALDFTYTSFWREGHNKNGIYPEDSYGNSEKQNFLTYGAKGGVLYKLTGRHYLSANGQYQTRPPLIRNSFVSARTRDHLVPGLEEETVFSGDFNYRIRYPKLKVRATFFYTEEQNKTWSRSFYHDDYRSFVNYSMTNVDFLYMGGEIGIKYKLFPFLEVSAAGSMADYIYNSRPSATITVDNSNEVLAEDRTVYLKNYRKGGIPQTVASGGLKFNKNYWFVGADFNWFDDNYLPLNPDRRTEAAIDQYVEGDPQWQDVIEQEKLESGYTIDVIGGKSFKFGDYYLSLFLTVDNILNETDLKRGGYENLRYNKSDIDQFPPNYAYVYGRTYFIMATFRF